MHQNSINAAADKMKNFIAGDNRLFCSLSNAALVETSVSSTKIFVVFQNV